MKAMKYITVLLGLVGLGLMAGCNSDIDDPDGPAVQLEIQAFDTAAVTASGGMGACIFQIPEWAATIANVPKNAIAVTSPFNDVTMQTVSVTYTWVDAPGALPAPTAQVIGLAGITIPVEGSTAVEFFPVDSGTLAGAGIGPATLNLSMVFNGQTIEGTAISVPAQAQLLVESCPP